MIQYTRPENWIKYDPVKIAGALTNAKAAVISLTSIPYQRSWVEQLQIIQLKREVAGTSRIEGADFTEKELDEALETNPKQLHTRSQRQAASTVKAYRWIQTLSRDYPVDQELILQIHRLVITGADDDHCPPGQLRRPDENVTFGSPRHRGVNGGPECDKAFAQYCAALSGEMRSHDDLVRALAAHYHLAAMHPFLDGNGRTARALESFFLQRSGLFETLFIAMSNYYYEEKSTYLSKLAEARSLNHDLTPFLIFGLQGVEIQCKRLFEEIRTNVSKALFRDVMYSLFNRLKTPRKRVIAERQIAILNILLKSDKMLLELADATRGEYEHLKDPFNGFFRDLDGLFQLKTIDAMRIGNDYKIFIRLEWPTEITETEFFKRIKEMPKAKTFKFLKPE